MTDFSDTPFVAGSLFGLRAFAVDRLGRLHGPSFNQVFRPDENEAECRKSEFGGFSRYLPGTVSVTASAWADPFSTMNAVIRQAYGLPEGGTAKVSVSPTTEVELNIEPPVHRVGQLDCSCGFYAYFDGGNDYGQKDRVSAIIEGYGVCTVGDRGFRASKARLAALIIPTKRRDQFALVARNYPDVPAYASVNAAVAEHPISGEQIPTPADESFWTRPIR